jgi:hypothetical protein
MNKINTWFNKIDPLFLLSPSFYTIVSGALIGAAINLLTGLIFTKKTSSMYIGLVIIFLLGSSGLLAYLGLILEDLRSKAGEDTDSLRRMIINRRKKLYRIVFTCVLVGVFLLICILCSINQ